jgi:molybdopterin-guanine dinucleotide biosynthesis protein A
MSATIAILAGGHSRRMRTDKSFVLLKGIPLIEHVIARVKPLALPLMILTNKPQAYQHLDLPLHEDVIPNKGSMGGILSALSYSQTRHTLCVACDMPFLNTALLAWLLQNAEEADAVVPYIRNCAEGLHAVYSKNCLEPLQTSIVQNQLKISSFLEQREVRWIHEAAVRNYDPDLCSFINLNTPDDLLRIG